MRVVTTFASAFVFRLLATVTHGDPLQTQRQFRLSLTLHPRGHGYGHGPPRGYTTLGQDIFGPAVPPSMGIYETPAMFIPDFTV